MDSNNSDANNVEVLLDEFESLYHTDEKRDILDCLMMVAEDIRPQVLQDLAAVELEILARQGRLPSLDDYADRLNIDPEEISATYHRSAKHGSRLASSTNKRIRDYQLIQKLGQGGMAEVYRARHSMLARECAIKLFRDKGPNRDKALARFKKEMIAQGKLDHPNLVKATDAGITSDGEAYIVMDLIDGSDLGEITRANGPFSVANACEIIRQVIEGLAHAHQQGLIHRDIKHSNVMLASSGKVMILDFGLAQVQTELTLPALTNTGDVFGTPHFMAPEQFEGAGDVTYAADFYSVGCLLYFLVTGRTPFAQYTHALHLLNAHYKEPFPDAADDVKNFPAELSQLLSRLTQKDPKRRITDAKRIGKVLHPFSSRSNLNRIAPRLVESKPDAQTDTSRLIQSVTVNENTIPPRNRNRWYTAAAGAFLFMVLGYVIFVTTDYGTLRVEVLDERLSVHVDDQAIKINDAGVIYRLRAGPKTVRIQSDELNIDVKKEFTLRRRDDKKLLHVILLANNEVQFGEGPAPDAPPAHSHEPTDLDGSTPEAMDSRAASIDSDPVPSNKTDEISFGDRLRRDAIDPYELSVAGRGDPKGAPREIVGIFGDSRMNHWGRVQCVAMSSDGKLIASGGWDNVVRVWDAQTFEQVWCSYSHGELVFDVEFSNDNTKLASGCNDGTIRVFDVASGTCRRTLAVTDKSIRAVEFLRNGNALLAASGDRLCRIIDLSTGQQTKIFCGHEGPVNDLAADESLDILVTASDDKQLLVWELSSGKEIGQMLGHDDSVLSVDLSPDGSKIVSGSADGTARLWELASRKQLRTIESGPNDVTSVQFDASGRFVASVGGNLPRSAYVWHLDDDFARMHAVLEQHHHAVIDVVFGGDGKQLVTASYDDRIHLWDIESRTDLTSDQTCFGIRAIAPSVSGFASISVSGAVVDQELDTLGESIAPIYRHESIGQDIKISDDGTLVASGSSDGTLHVWSRAEKRLLLSIPARVGKSRSIAFSPNGRYVAVGGEEPIVKVYELATGLETSKLKTSGDNQSLGYASDGSYLCSGTVTGSLFVFDCDSTQLPGKRPREIRNLHDRIFAIAISADNRFIATAGFDDEIHIWNSNTLRKTATISTPGVTQNSVLDFSPDGKTLMTAGNDGSLRFWSTIDFRLSRVVPFSDSNATMRRAYFMGDSRHVVTANENGTSYVLRVFERNDSDEDKSEFPNLKLAERRRLSSSVLDSLKREDSDPYELSVAAEGGVEAAKEIVAILGDSRLKHWRSVSCVSQSSDSRYLVSGGSDRSVRVWDLQTKRLRHLLHGHGSTIADAKFDSSGKLLASSDYDGKLIFWNVQTGEIINEAKSEFGSIRTIEFLSDGRLVSAGRDGRIRFWNQANATIDLEFPSGATLNDDIALQHDASLLAYEGKEFAIQIRKLDSEQLVATLVGHRDRINSLDFNSDSTKLISGSHDGTVRLWDVTTGTELKQILKHRQHGATDFSVCFTKDDRIAVVGQHVSSCYLFDANGDPIADFVSHYSGTVDLDLLDDGSLVTAGSDARIGFWNPETQMPTSLHFERQGSIWSVDHSAEYQSVFLAGADGALAAFDPTDPLNFSSMYRHESNLVPAEVSPDGSVVAVAGNDSILRILDVKTLNELSRFYECKVESDASETVAGRIRELSFHPSQKRIAMSTDRGVVRVRDYSLGAVVFTRADLVGDIWALDYSPDGKTIVAGISELDAGQLDLFLLDAETGKTIIETRIGSRSVSAAEFLPSGDVVVLALRSGKLQIRDVRRKLHLLKEVDAHEFYIGGLSISPDGRLLATASHSGTVKVFDTSDWSERREIRLGTTGCAVRSVKFAADSRHLLTANSNGTGYVLRLETLDEAKRSVRGK